MMRALLLCLVALPLQAETLADAWNLALERNNALAAVRIERPDLLLLDMHLPDIDGLDLLTHLKADDGTAGIPVIVLSADATPERVARALHAGAEAYLSKPLNLAELLQHVVRHLRVPKTMAHLNPDRSDIFNHTPGAGIVHLAAHGSLRRDNPAYSFIELADGPLYVHDLLHLQLPSSTVVLTACSSARGSAPAGDEWIGLARGFLQAGASTVIASLWPIQDEPTVELMDCFYEELTSGLTAPEALGAAMRRLMRTRPHPWHWASFAVLGGVDQ